MSRLVIGSTALNHHVPGSRQPDDLDVFTDQPAKGEDAFWHSNFPAWLPPDTNRVATLDELYTIKVSHSYWQLRNGSWNKHMSDVVALKHAGAKLMPELHSMLYWVWEQEHGKKRVNLALDAMDFFADAVKRKYNHDSIHASVAYGKEPMYVRFLIPGETVKMDMAAIKTAPYPDQVHLFREEVYATALERIMIPKDYNYSPGAAYAWSLRRTITSLTKGWSARFLVENYDVFREPDVDYVARHKENAHRLLLLEDPNC
ncbi:hypothetical protein AB0M54_45850 [Actinoplanes sp. NPDC051470]|uniref:DUF7275 domain-containing protein n=1 Tax=Actinoplanes sp. NPDC051470 TaxID=3157224 RepID=UPI0034408A0C